MTVNAEKDKEEPAVRPSAPPPRYKMAVINWISAYPLITILLWVCKPLIQRVPVYITTLVFSLVLVCLLTFIIMPLMMKLFSGWLRRG